MGREDSRPNTWRPSSTGVYQKYLRGVSKISSGVSTECLQWCWQNIFRGVGKISSGVKAEKLKRDQPKYLQTFAYIFRGAVSI
jgi:hypothetical protein